ncbi:MAG: HAMP domain-containing protein [Acidimicrobiia bacterium]|nr:HAMP domain-containing protein [Acidimicrobiia bacterium]
MSADSTSWLNRPRKLRRMLVTALVLVTLASVLLVGGLNFVAARRLLDDGTSEQMQSVGELRSRNIETGGRRLLSQVSAASHDLGVVAALRALNTSFQDLATASLDPAQSRDLDRAYQVEVVDPIVDAGLVAGVELTVADVEPGSNEGRYLQYHYTLLDPATRAETDDPGDGSAYSATHAEQHPFLSDLARSLGVSDLLLVNDDGEVIYSDQKRIDFGADLVKGPLSDSVLAALLSDDLAVARTGDAVISDYEVYVPGGAAPALFTAAAVRDGGEVIGALATRLDTAALNSLTTADGQWEAVGLGDGESYVVSADELVLQSESRRWLEDPQGYLAAVDDPELAALIETLGSPVGLQPVDTEPVRQAIEGRSFLGSAKNYLGQSTLSYATPIDIGNRRWVMVAEVPLDDARAPLYDYARRLGLVILVVVPIAALLGFWLASRLTRPIPPVVDAALAVAGGDRDPQLPDLGRDEFGDLGRRLVQMANELGRREAELADEFERKRELLLTVLPARAVDAEGDILVGGGVADEVTVIAVGIDPAEGTTVEADRVEVLSHVSAAAERLAADRGLERVRSSADQFLFLAGHRVPSDGADAGLEFAGELARAIQTLATDEGAVLSVRMGLSTGPVGSGVLARGSLTFGAWGEPVRRALAIEALSRSDEVLVDASTAAAADTERWALRSAPDVVDLSGRAMDVFVLVEG